MKYNEELLLTITLGVYKFFYKLHYVFIRTSTFQYLFSQFFPSHWIPFHLFPSFPFYYFPYTQLYLLFGSNASFIQFNLFSYLPHIHNQLCISCLICPLWHCNHWHPQTQCLECQVSSKMSYKAPNCLVSQYEF